MTSPATQFASRGSEAWSGRLGRRTIGSVILAFAICPAGILTIGTGASAAGLRTANVAQFMASKNAKTLTKTQFISEANALCSAAASQAAVALKPYAGIRSSHTPQEIAAFVKAYASVVQTQINKTKALKPPTKDVTKVTAMLKEDQTELNMLKANPQLLGSSQSPFLGADTLARKFGLEDAPGTGSCQPPKG